MGLDASLLPYLTLFTAIVALVLQGVIATSGTRRALDALSTALDSGQTHNDRHVERLLEKLLAKNQMQVTAQHSIEEQDKQRLQAFVEAKQEFMKNPPPRAPVAEINPEEMQADEQMPYDLEVG